MADDFVVPTNIPWDDLSAEPLEELVFWLLDAIGAKDLQWRIGATRHHAVDGGRDLEATFQRATPDGELVAERWWVQCKGRSSAVDRRVVQDSATDAEAVDDVDVALVVTNSRFTNPARDWASSRNTTRRRPNVRLWDRESLERLLMRHPAVVARAAPEALSIHGRLAALTSQFLNQMYFPGPSDLEAIWVHRANLNWDTRALVTVLAGELTNGDVAMRPWALWAPEEDLLGSLVMVLINGPFLATRCVRFGIDSNKIVRTAAYLCLVALMRLGEGQVAKILEDPWTFARNEPIDPGVLRVLHECFIEPVVGHLELELGDVCSRDCARISADPVVWSEPDTNLSYWDRFIAAEARQRAPEEDSHRLVIEFFENKCTVDVVVGVESCPLFDDDVPIAMRLGKIREIVQERMQRRVHSSGGMSVD